MGQVIPLVDQKTAHERVIRLSEELFLPGLTKEREDWIWDEIKAYVARRKQ